MTPRLVGFVLRIVLLAAAVLNAWPAHAADRPTSTDGDLVVWGLDDEERPWTAWVERDRGQARVTAVRPGIVIAARGALWRWATKSMRAPARLSCETDGAMNGHGRGTVVRATLERVGRGRGAEARRQNVVRPPFAAALETVEYEHHVTLDGSVGPLLFVTDEAYDYTCGAHGGTGFGFRVWDAQRGAPVDLRASMTAAERATLRARARRSLAADPDFGDGDPDAGPGPADVHPSRMSPVFAQDGRLRLSHAYWTDTCYACGDGEWDSYTRSARVESDALPRPLRAYARIEGLAGLPPGALPFAIRGVAVASRSLQTTFAALPSE